MKYHFRIDNEAPGRIYVQCLETHFCGCVCANAEEVPVRAAAALRKYLAKNSSYMLPPIPIPGSDEAIAKVLRVDPAQILSVPVEPTMAFAILLREARTRRRLFQEHAAERLGMRNVSAYRRLEDPLRANPTILTIAKIRRVFPEIELGSVFES